MGTRQIVLNDGRIVQVDDEDFEWAAQFKWSHSGERKARGLLGYAAHGGKIGKVRWVRYMHREIAVRAGILESYEDPKHTDHRNLDHFDNRRENLRAVTVGQNNHNRRSRTASGLQGVYLLRGKSWCAEISVDGERHRKYGFATAEAANRWRYQFEEAL